MIHTNLEQAESYLQDKLKALFEGRDAAWIFLCKYLEYCHVYDDMVDEPKNVVLVERSAQLASEIYNSEYWKRYCQNLVVLERLIHVTYFDCVKWEKSDEQWKREHARVLNHCGYNMLFAVVLIEFGEDRLKEISLEYREFAHKNHAESV